MFIIFYFSFWSQKVEDVFCSKWLSFYPLLNVVWLHSLIKLYLQEIISNLFLNVLSTFVFLSMEDIHVNFAQNLKDCFLLAIHKLICVFISNLVCAYLTLGSIVIFSWCSLNILPISFLLHLLRDPGRFCAGNLYNHFREWNYV